MTRAIADRIVNSKLFLLFHLIRKCTTAFVFHTNPLCSIAAAIKTTAHQHQVDSKTTHSFNLHQHNHKNNHTVMNKARFHFHWIWFHRTLSTMNNVQVATTRAYSLDFIWCSVCVCVCGTCTLEKSYVYCFRFLSSRFLLCVKFTWFLCLPISFEIIRRISIFFWNVVVVVAISLNAWNILKQN